MSGAKKKMERRAAQAQAGLTEREKQELKAQKAKRRNSILAVIAGIVIVALVVALLVWNSGFFARHTTALTVKDHKYTVADMDYYYFQTVNNAYDQEQQLAQFYAQNNLGEYTASFDPNGDLKTQYVDEAQTQNYHDYFMDQAKESAVQVTALYDAAQAAGHTLSEEGQTSLDTLMDSVDEMLDSYGFGSRDAYLKAVYGRNVTEKVYRRNAEMRIVAYDYYTAATAEMKDYSDEEIQAFYQENSGTLDSYDYDLAYFDGTVATKDSEGNDVEVTDQQKTDAMNKAKSDAQALVDAVKAAAGETPAQGEEKKTMADLGSDLGASVDQRVNSLGAGFRTSVFAEWLMDSARKDGDVDLFEVENSGWYVVQFHGRALYDEPTVDARHILVSFVAEEGVEHERDENGNIIYTDAENAAAKEKAQSLLDQYNAGEKTAEAFGTLADENSNDGRNSEGELNAKGGLYSSIHKGDMVKPFEDWCFDAARKAGDTGLVETSFGWHVMYYQAYHEPEWKTQAQSDKTTADQTAFEEGVEEGYEAVESSGWSQVGQP